jgi:hypothetical protein
MLNSLCRGMAARLWAQYQSVLRPVQNAFCAANCLRITGTMGHREPFIYLLISNSALWTRWFAGQMICHQPP